MKSHRQCSPPHDETKLILDHIDIVKEVLGRLSMRFPRHVDREDLWSAGAVGLVEAAGRFEPSRGIAFAAYARVRVAGAMIDATRKRDWAPRSLRRDAREIEASTNDFRHGAGREPTDDELARRLGITATALAKTRADAASSMVWSLDRATIEGTAPEDDVIDLTVGHDPEKEALRRETIEMLRDAVEHLPPRSRDIVRRYYLEGDRLQDIAADTGVSAARVSQLRAEAISALRSLFREYAAVA